MDDPKPEMPPAPPPAPPLPPPLPPSAPIKASNSPDREVPASKPIECHDPIPPKTSEPQPHEPVNYFFYGTLCNATTLARVLNRAETPQFRPAQVVGYELSHWGQYRTLLSGPAGQPVEGVASLIMSAEEERKLAYYETNAYTLVPCRIMFTDSLEPVEVEGRTFMYAGDARALKQGKFDRALWEARMGVRLPPAWGSG